MDYSKTNLHILRMYAKEIGVKSPSVYTKSVLIEKIKDVKSGKTKPYYSKRGRPTSETYLTALSGEKAISKQRLMFIVSEIKKLLTNLEKEIEKLKKG